MNRYRSALNRLGISLLSLLAIEVTAHAAASVQAKLDGVQVTDKPAAQGSVLSTMKKGDTLPAKERKGMFWEVQLPGNKTGYVSFIKVQRIEAQDTGLSSAIRSAAEKSRGEDGKDQSRARSSVMGVRGLSDGEELQAAGSVRPNMRMVYLMEDREVTSKEVKELADSVQTEIEHRMKQRGMIE